MPAYCRIKRAPPTCDDQVKCWDDRELEKMKTYGLGNAVPSIGKERYYSVQYNLDTSKYWHVCDNVIVSVDATEPMATHPVFDKWGALVSQGRRP